MDEFDGGNWSPHDASFEHQKHSPERNRGWSGRGQSPERSSDWLLGRNRRESPERNHGLTNSGWEPTEGDHHQVEETEDPSDHSSHLFSVRYENSWRLGLDPQEYGRNGSDAQISTSDTSHSEIERHNSRLHEQKTIGYWLDSTKGKYFKNILVYHLQEELAQANQSGVRPVHVDDPDFGEVANTGKIHWVVTLSGELLVAPKWVGGREVAETVLTDGEPVLAAGDAMIAVDDHGCFGCEITNRSEHYQPDEKSLSVGKKAFETYGITFAMEEKYRYSGHDGSHGGQGEDPGPSYAEREGRSLRKGEMAAGEDGMDGNAGKGLRNQLVDYLEEELATAHQLGVRPVRVDDPDFGEVANTGTINWVVTQMGELLVAPKSVEGRAIAETVLTQGRPVRAAGEVTIAVYENGCFGCEITNRSEHSQPDEQSLQIGKQAFKEYGITFVMEENYRYGGNGKSGGSDERDDGGYGGHDGEHGDGYSGGHGRNRPVHDGYDSSSDEDDKNGGDAQKLQEAAAKLEENWENRTFRSERRFVKHCNDHLSEWSPTLTAEQYVAKARELLSAPPDANIEGFISESGQYIYKYNNATNEFAIGMADGVISTFYKPDAGRAYWLSEIKKNGGPHVFGGK